MASMTLDATCNNPVNPPSVLPNEAAHNLLLFSLAVLLSPKMATNTSLMVSATYAMAVVKPSSNISITSNIRIIASTTLRNTLSNVIASPESFSNVCRMALPMVTKTNNRAKALTINAKTCTNPIPAMPAAGNTRANLSRYSNAPFAAVLTKFMLAASRMKPIAKPATA